MIRLSAETPLGTGRHRKCYAHPDDAQRCIKIVYNSGHGGDKETQRVDWPHEPPDSWYHLN